MNKITLKELNKLNDASILALYHISRGPNGTYPIPDNFKLSIQLNKIINKRKIKIDWTKAIK